MSDWNSATPGSAQYRVYRVGSGPAWTLVSTTGRDAIEKGQKALNWLLCSDAQEWGPCRPIAITGAIDAATIAGVRKVLLASSFWGSLPWWQSNERGVTAALAGRVTAEFMQALLALAEFDGDADSSGIVVNPSGRFPPVGVAPPPRVMLPGEVRAGLPDAPSPPNAVSATPRPRGGAGTKEGAEAPAAIAPKPEGMSTTGKVALGVGVLAVLAALLASRRR